MGVVQLNQIKKNVLEGVGPHIDVSDTQVDQQVAVRLTRSLAAFALAQLLVLDDATAAATVTDGYDDNGIDAIAIDVDSSRVYLVQSKWSNAGTGSPALGDVHKFLKGFDDLINADSTGSTPKSRRIRPSLSKRSRIPTFGLYSYSHTPAKRSSLTPRTRRSVTS